MLTKHNNDLKWIDLTFEAWFLLIFDFIWDSYTFKESNSVSNTCKERFQLEIQKDFQPIVINKGQLISKSLFVVFNFFQKTNKNKFELRYHSSKVEFVCLFFGRNVGLKKSFRVCLTFRISERISCVKSAFSQILRIFPILDKITQSFHVFLTFNVSTISSKVI